MKFYCILLLLALLPCIYALEAEITKVVKVKKKSFNCSFKIHYEGDICFDNSSVSCSPNDGRKVKKNVELALVDKTIISIKKLKINPKKDEIVGCKATSPTSQVNTSESNTKCLTSPDYPNNYRDNSDILLALSVPDGQKMEITFQYFDVEDLNLDSGSTCPYDYLAFYGNGKIIGKKLCGTTLPQKLIISTSTASAYFTSDETVTRKGFKFCYKPIISPVPNEACKCGLAKRNPRIVGGNETGINEYPWLVAIVLLGQSPEKPWIRCGGTLINSRWVLTAGHCLEDHNLASVRVLLGEHNRNITGESIMVNRSVIDQKIHLKYEKHRSYFDYDYSLLKLDHPINFSQYSHIRPACLPKNENIGPEPDSGLAGKIATVAGWGRIKEIGPVSDYAREVDVKIYNGTQCKSAISSKFTNSMICAGIPDGGKDACIRDGGGPLIYTSGNGESPGENYELTGVVSWGDFCAKPGIPSVYAKVSHVLPWIMKTADKGTWCPRT